MKKNLTRLYEQAVYEQTVESLLEAPERIADRFSELIIRECVHFMKVNSDAEPEELFNHFGIKE